MKNKNNLFEVDNIDFSYDLGSQKIQALRGLSLKMPEKSLITLSGPSGSGKSTLLNLLGLIEPVQEGEIHFLGENVREMNGNKLNEIRKFQIGFVFQQFHLIPVLTAEENIAYFLKRQGLNKEEIHFRTKEALETVGLWEHRKKRPSELSGGQRQRVAIARAMAKKPAVIIGDEVTASLDQVTGREIMKFFEELVREKSVSVILTTHDPMVLEFSEKNYHIQDGQLMGDK